MNGQGAGSVRRNVCVSARRLAGAIAIAGASLLAAGAAWADGPAVDPGAMAMAGDWHIEGRLAGHAIHLFCRFDETGPDFGGLCFGDGTHAQGNFEKGHAVWRWKAENHMLTFSGVLADGRLSGKVSTVAFAGIDVSGSMTAERPGAGAPPAASAAAAPAGMAALRAVLNGLAHGELAGESCTSELAEGLRKEMPSIAPVYQTLGPVKSISFVDRLGEPGDSVMTEIYDVRFASAKRICSIDVTKSDKLSDLICRDN